MKEHIIEFLEKAESNDAWKGKLEQIKQNYMTQLISLSQEVGIPLTAEDIFAETTPLTDNEMAEANGGIRNPYQPLIIGSRFVPFK